MDREERRSTFEDRFERIGEMHKYNGVYPAAMPLVWVDPETHCQYLIIDRGDRIAMTPRLDNQGRPMCGV